MYNFERHIMLSSTLDLLGDLINGIVWFVNGLASGDPLYAWGSSF